MSAFLAYAYFRSRQFLFVKTPFFSFLWHPPVLCYVLMLYPRSTNNLQMCKLNIRKQGKADFHKCQVYLWFLARPLCITPYTAIKSKCEDGASRIFYLVLTILPSLQVEKYKELFHMEKIMGICECSNEYIIWQVRQQISAMWIWAVFNSRIIRWIHELQDAMLNLKVIFRFCILD